MDIIVIIIFEAGSVHGIIIVIMCRERDTAKVNGIQKNKNEQYSLTNSNDPCRPKARGHRSSRFHVTIKSQLFGMCMSICIV